MPTIPKTVARDHRESVARSIPTTGGARAAGAWLWNLLRADGIEFYNYDKASGRFTIAHTVDENAGQGSEEWAAPSYAVDDALEFCFLVDPDLEHVPGAHLDAMARRFRPAPEAKKPRRTVTELVKILDAIRAAHLADEALLTDEHLAAITEVLDRR